MGNNILGILLRIVTPLLLGICGVVVVLAAQAGKPLPLITNPRSSLIAVLVIGMTMCAAGGIGQVGASGRWASPLAIVGYLLGVTILVVAMSVFTGWKIPMITGETQAVAAVGILTAIKYLIGTAGFIFHWL